MSIGLYIIEIMSVQPTTRSYIAKIVQASDSRLGSDEVEFALSIAKEESNSTKLLLGDSVALQLFQGLSGVNTTYTIDPTNQAIQFVGQYVLLTEYLNHHNGVQDVFLVVAPQTLSTDIDPFLSYQYVAIPMIQNGYQEYMDDIVWTKLESQFGKLLLNRNVIDFIDRSCVNRKLFYFLIGGKLKEEKTELVDIISDINLRYLHKMLDLCNSKNVKFHLLPAPMKDTDVNHQYMEAMKTKWQQLDLENDFPLFCQSVSFFPAEMFKDELHFSEEYETRESKNIIIQKMLEQNKMNINLFDIMEPNS